MNSSSSYFLKKIEHEWETEIQPIIEDICECITMVIEKKGDPSIYRKCEPVNLYSKIYKLTINHQFDFSHLDFLYNKEIQSFVVFCKKFNIRDLSGMNRQVQGFRILLKWFNCFFHHLNRFRHRSYYNINTIEDDMVFSIRNHYIKPQKKIISHLIHSKWTEIRNNNYPIDTTLLESMNIISTFYPKYYSDILFLYFQNLREYSEQKSEEWFPTCNILSYMENTYLYFQNETNMFLYYFIQYQELSHVYSILKRVFVYPNYKLFIEDNKYGWKSLLFANNFSDIQTAYHFFSLHDDISLWLKLYKEFLEEKISTFTAENMVISLAKLLKDQSSMLYDIFMDEKLKIEFTTTLEKTIQEKIKTQDNNNITLQLVKTIQHFIHKKSSIPVIKDLLALVGFLPENDSFYKNYQSYLKTRLLSGRFYLPNEKAILEYLKVKMGMSFVLNLQLMLDEIQKKCLQQEQYSMYNLSSIVWDLKKDKFLKYKFPDKVRDNLQELYDKWQKQTDPSIRLELLWFNGIVILTRDNTDFYMNPIQAIVLMSLEQPSTRHELVNKLEIDDDSDHNLDGVLESLTRAMLIFQHQDQWCWNTTNYKTNKIIVPPIRKTKQAACQQEREISSIVIKAFIVSTLKREKILKYFKIFDMVLKKYKDIKLQTIRIIIDSLIDNDYLSKDKDNNLCYVP